MCRCGCGFGHVSSELRGRLEKARQKAATPFVVTSACRCETHNRRVGGHEKSSHLKGLAVDIAVDGNNREKILEALKENFDRIGIAKNFIHVDIDPLKPVHIWYYQ